TLRDLHSFPTRRSSDLYAKQDAERHDDVACPGCGFVDVFNTHGQLLRRLVSQGHLNAPWGLEIVNGQLWVGNFGDGRINVYDPRSESTRLNSSHGSISY